MRFLIGLCLLVVSGFCFAASQDQSKPLIVTSIQPLSMVAQEIVPEANVLTLLQANQNPHHASFTPEQARLLSEADLVIWLGKKEEPAVARLLAKRQGPSLFMASLEGVHLLALGESHDHDHHHGHDHHHENHSEEHKGTDLHLWLDPHNMTLLAEELSEQQMLRDLVPQRDLQNRAKHFSERMRSIEESASAQFRAVQQRWITGHDTWGYLVHAFGLPEPLFLSSQPDSEPGARKLVELRKQVKSEGVACIVLEPEARVSLLKKVCPECRVEQIDPLARGEQAHWPEYLLSVFERFKRCLLPAASL
jgi:zinc transport system substrate-binding protein